MISFLKRNLESIILITLVVGGILTYKLCSTVKKEVNTETSKLSELRAALFLSDSFKLAAQGKLESYEVIIADMEKNPKLVYKTVYKDTGSIKYIIKNPEAIVIYTDTATGPRVSLPFSYPLHSSEFWGSIEGKADSTMEVKIDTIPNKVEITREVKRDPKNKHLTNTLVTIKNTNPILSNNNTRVDTIHFSKINDDGLQAIEDAGREAGHKEGKKKGFWNGIKTAGGVIVTVALYLLIK